MVLIVSRDDVVGIAEESVIVKGGLDPPWPSPTTQPLGFGEGPEGSDRPLLLDKYSQHL